jgi:hypothetical protein
MFARRSATITLALLLTVSTVPALTGCSLISGAVKNATGGNVDVGGAAVPEGFPAEVPLIDGKVTFGAAVGNDKDGHVYNVTILTTDADPLTTASTKLTDAGFTTDEALTGSSAATKASGFTNGTYGVLVVVADTDKDGTIVNYTVTPATK